MFHSFPVLIATLLLAAPLEPTDLSAKTALVFKNGYGFIEQAGTAMLQDGWFAVPETPQASFGLIWIGAAASGLRVDRAVSRVEDEAIADYADTLDELMLANEGRLVTLFLSGSGLGSTVTGVLGRPVYQQRVRQPDYPPTPDALMPVPPRAAPPWPPAQYVEYVTLLKSDGTTALVPRSRVESLQFEEPPTRSRSVPRQVRRTEARVVGEGGVPAAGEVPVTLTYMRKGITWLPSYRIELDGEGTARVGLDATLINDAADLHGTRVGFIVGVPNFILQNMLSPASVRMTWEGLSPYFSTGYGDSTGYSQMMVTQMANTAALRTAEAGPGMMGAAFEQFDTGAGAKEDLFVYTVEDVDLPIGGRGLFRVTDDEVPYRDVYLLTLDDAVASDFREVSERITDPELVTAIRSPRVWHAVRLTNTTEGPWTTGAATTIAKGLPAGQSMMTFTPPGKQVDLKLTVAPDVTASREETEISRQTDALRTRNRSWNKVTIAGRVRIANATSSPAQVLVRRAISGTFTEVTEGGSFRPVATSAYAVNPNSEATWDLTVEPGGEREIGFSYYVYVSY